MPWINIDNRWVLKQSEIQSCGYCCIGMVLNLMGHGSPSEKLIIEEGKRIGALGAYDRNTSDRAGIVATPFVTTGIASPHWGSGTYGDHLSKVLEQGYKIRASYYHGMNTSEINSAMKQVSANHYMIALVQWKTGGGHWVLVVERKKRGVLSDSEYTVLDPQGYVVKNLGTTNYTALYNTGSVAGSFAGYYVVADGR